MLSNQTVKQRITGVDAPSPASRARLREGMLLLSVNGEAVRDLIDYTYLTDGAVLKLELERNGRRIVRRIRKAEGEPLGLQFSSSLMSDMRTCKNHCLFCFIDQMPTGTRTSLHVKDDDWRMSFIMGNYVTLTNVPDDELDRILRRRVSPLYVSVHATAPETRIQMMRNPAAGRLMERLSALRQSGLAFHAQIVLCPGVNDGKVLEQTLADLLTLVPACRSIAVIPVGITQFREGLAPLRGYTKEEAARLIDAMQPWQTAFADRLGEPGLFLADEWYLMAGRQLPPSTAYADFPQIENGVGLLRKFESEFLSALEGRTPLPSPRTVDMIGGTAAYPFFSVLYRQLSAYRITVRLHPIQNRFFGGNVHVAGLVTGKDILGQLNAAGLSDALFLPSNMLRENDTVFLDNLRLSELGEALHTRAVAFSDGEDLIDKLFEV